ncbi:MAG: Hachiman antiphage defense system protein HamA [Verrucomicrobiales bacterium]
MSEPWTDRHIQWLKNTGESVQTADGKDVEIFEFEHQEDEEVLTAWARHFRNHYCHDSQIDALARGTGDSKADYLKNIKFPDGNVKPGPSIRAGDFAEILTADYLEFVLNYWVPRTRYRDKVVRNESTKGTDTVGFLFSREGQESRRDRLAMFESKAKFSGTKALPKLQQAVDHSSKDVARKAESLNAIKQRLLDSEDLDGVGKVERFQDEVGRPYTQVFGAVAHLDSKVFDIDSVEQTDCQSHDFPDDLILVVIQGDSMMKLVHSLYRRAADEA